MRDYLTAQIKQVETLAAHPNPQPQHLDELRSMLAEIERRATAQGMPEIVKACQIRSGAISITLARQVLAECLSHCPDDEPTTLNPGDVAKELAVSPDTVLTWINTKQLKAANIAKGNRPRWIIQRSALDKFLQLRSTRP